jgi:hypothetical protein
MFQQLETFALKHMVETAPFEVLPNGVNEREHCLRQGMDEALETKAMVRVL